MNEKIIPFSNPYFSNEDLTEITVKIKKVLQSGWLTSGPMVQKFENEFSEFTGSQYVVALNSCTAALHTILLALGIKSGDEVIVPSNTFVATANVCLYVGAMPIFVDSDPETFNISPSEIQNKISRKTKAIIIVHVYGNPCAMKEINEIAEDSHIPVIGDCAHAHGSRYKENHCANLGVAGAFSFYPTKIITTAEGGIITTNREDLAEKARVIRNHGRASYGPAKIVELGFNYRLSDIHAVLGLTQLEHINDFVEHRNKIAKIYNRELSKIKWCKPQKVKNGNLSSYYAYVVKIIEDAPVSRDELVSKLKDQNIATSIMYYPVHLQPFYINLLGSNNVSLPVAEEIGNQSVALPIYNDMSFNDVNYVINAIKQIDGGNEH